MNIETKCIHGGYKGKEGAPTVLPIYQSTSYVFDSAEHVANLFNLEAAGHIYSRISNPTLAFVEEKIANMEGGAAAMLTSSGQSAILLAALTVCEAGDHILSSAEIYGGATNLFAVTLKRLGIETTFVDPNAPNEVIEQEIKPNTKFIFGETLSNPSLNVLDIEKFAKIADKHGVLLIVDNTFATPVLCRPIEHGAHVVLHSTSKYLDGHATVLGGAIVDSGKFNFKGNDRYKKFNEPDSSYHGVVYTESFPQMPFLLKARVQLMRDFGATSTPMNAFILNYGIESLHLRMERHSQNALKVAKFLEARPEVSSVSYPGLESSPQATLAKKYLKNGASGVLSFTFKGGKEAAMAFMNKLQLVSIIVHVADVRTCILHPFSSTHRQLSQEQMKEARVTEDLVRLSVGIENADDIIADLTQAFQK